MSRSHLYSTLPAYVGFDVAMVNYSRGFGRQRVGGMSADAIMCGAQLPRAIGTRDGICALWQFSADCDYLSVERHIADAHDYQRRADIYDAAFARTGDVTYRDRADHFANRSEMAYGSAMEIRYNVQ